MSTQHTTVLTGRAARRELDRQAKRAGGRPTTQSNEGPASPALSPRPASARIVSQVPDTKSAPTEAADTEGVRSTLPALPTVATLQAVIDAEQSIVEARLALDAAVRVARDDGHSWAELARALGVSRQAVRARFITRL